jgi:NAD-dependent dihydropyrimidine dehydrogenase PreA subunit
VIELIVEDRCIACGQCVSACPTHVFDTQENGRPVIARANQCQTCFLCELYCAQDAIYVGPDQTRQEPIDPQAVIASGHLGRMRLDQGWNHPADRTPLDQYWRLGPLLGRGAQIAAERYAKQHGAEPDD